MWARLLLVSIGLLGGTAGAQGESAPVCKAPTSRISEPDRKFHPGHYVAIGKAEGAKAITKAANKGVTGVQLRYRWAMPRARGRSLRLFGHCARPCHSEAGWTAAGGDG